jgi:hypothetical protein
MRAGRYLTRRSGRHELRNLALPPLLALLAAGSAVAATKLATTQPADADKSSRTRSAATLVQTVVAEDAAPFAVVELFTSESCPSCPAADRLLSEMSAEARKRGQRLMPLAFHVDYWKTGSAADPFSDPAFARRQRFYAAMLSSEDDVYTPQMFVNGRAGFVGSERATAERQIKSALSRPATATVSLGIEAGKSADTLQVNCDVRTTATNATLQLAVVERGLFGHGRSKLDNVVRVFKSIPLSKGNHKSVELQLPRDLNRKNASIVGYIQDSRNLSILGATSVDLESAPVERVARSK